MERIKISNQGWNLDEQKDRDGRCASRKNPIQEIGWQLKERGRWRLPSKSKWRISHYQLGGRSPKDVEECETMISSRQGWTHPEQHDQEHHHHMRGGIRSSPWISSIFQIITCPLVLFSFVETFPLIYVIELFWNSTKSLRFVLLLCILTIALSSVLIL